MKRKFFTNLLLLLILNLLIKPFWVFGIDRTVQNLVGSSEYGLFFSLFNFTLLFNIFLDLGITNYNNRNLSINASKVQFYISHIAFIRFILGLLYAIITFFAGWLLGYEKRQLWLLFVLIINQFLSSFILYLRSNVSGMQFYTTDSILSVLDRTIMIVLCSLALWGHVLGTSFKIEWFAYIQTISYAITCFVVFSVVLSKSKGINITFQKNVAKKIILESLPFALLIFLMTIYNRSDSIMLERLLPNGAKEAGIYAQSFRILDALIMFAYLFPTLLYPMFSSLIGKGEDVRRLASASFSLLFVVSVMTSVSFFAYRCPIMRLMYHDAENSTVSVFSILIAGFVPMAVSYIFGTLLTAKGMLKQLNYVALVSVAANISLNVLFIPVLGAKGAAISCLATQILSCILQVILCQSCGLFRFQKADIVKYTTFILFSCLTTYLIHLRIENMIPGILLSATVTGIMGIISGIIPVNAIKQKIIQYLREA